jgi:hypothetical protein
MAEEEAAAKGLSGLMKAKIGPVPLPIIAIAGLGLWYYLQRKNASGSGTAAPNQQTDPAGNVGSIDPSTGYVYGTPEDTASLSSTNSGGGSGSSGTSGSTVSNQYTTDAAWSVAAINYLVGLGIDPTTANQAIGQFLSSQNLTPTQQGDVNLAIQGLGAPPEPPTPSTSNPNPINSAGGGSTTTTGPAIAGSYTVTGTTNPSDQYPEGVVIAAYKLSSTDSANIAVDSGLLLQANSGVTPPYPVGTTLKIPQVTSNEILGGSVSPATNTTSAVVPKAAPAAATSQVAPVAPRPVPNASVRTAVSAS